MAILLQSSSNWTLSLRVLLISSGVLSAALMLKVSVPAATEFVLSDVPLIWGFLASWLRPPYLYLVINCIIITIVATSRLQSKFTESSPSPAKLDGMIPIQPAKVHEEVWTNYAHLYGTNVLKNEPMDEIRDKMVYDHDENAVKVSEFDAFAHLEAKLIKKNTETTVPELAPTTESIIFKQKIDASDEFFIPKHSRASPRKESTEYYALQANKPLVSARFGHRKVVKASPEGGKTLGVTKPKRQETLESTWKTITEGRGMPLARHLRKSDTWEAHGRHQHQTTPPDDGDADPTVQHQQRMIKSETFNDGGVVGRNLKLRKEASVSQEELNRRVEAFIHKFNEDMRLQRQESLNLYMEMIHRSAAH